MKKIVRHAPSSEKEEIFRSVLGRIDWEIENWLARVDKIKNIDQLVIALENLFQTAKSYESNIIEIEHLRKKKIETYTDFCRRLLHMTLRTINDIERIEDEAQKSHLKLRTENKAMNVLKKNIFDNQISIALHDAENLTEALAIVETLEHKIYDGEIHSASLPIQTIEKVNFIKSKTNTCQRCNKSNHEYLYCPEQNCIYCDASDHKSVNCQIIPNNERFVDVCKNCNEKGHTIDFCSKNEGDFCQICQGSGHKIHNCAVKIMKYCGKCRQLSHGLGMDCPNIMTYQNQNFNNNNQNRNNYDNFGNYNRGQNNRDNRQNSHYSNSNFHGQNPNFHQNSHQNSNFHGQNPNFRQNPNFHGQHPNLQNQNPNWQGQNSNFQGQNSNFHGRNQNSNYQPNQNRMRRNNMVCYNCNKPGHIARNCRFPRRNQGSNYNNNNSGISQDLTNAMNQLMQTLNNQQNYQNPSASSSMVGQQGCSGTKNPFTPVQGTQG